VIGYWMRLRRLARDRGDAGFTLAELLCVMVALGVLTTAVAFLFVTDLKVTGQNKARLDQQNSGRLAMDSISRVLRTAVTPKSLASCGDSCGAAAAFMSGDAFKVSFYADINNDGGTVGPSEVTLSVDDDGVLRQTVRPADPGSAAVGFTWDCTLGTAGCTMRTTVLASGVQKNVGNLFTYYAYGSDTPITGTLNATQLADVDAIDISLTTRAADGAEVMPTTFIGRVSLPNVDTVVEASLAAGG